MGMVLIISVVLIIFMLLFLMFLFYFFLKVILVFIIMVVVFGFIDYKEVFYFWKIDCFDFWMLIIIFIVILGLGIE